MSALMVWRQWPCSLHAEFGDKDMLCLGTLVRCRQVGRSATRSRTAIGLIH